MSEQRQRKLSLKNDKGETKDYFFDFIPYSKKLEYIRLEAELEKKEEVLQSDYDELQAEFVAGLFESEEVTKESILNGLDSQDFGQVWEIVRYRVLGYSKEEDELIKKAQMEEILAGLTSTNSTQD